MVLCPDHREAGVNQKYFLAINKIKQVKTLANWKIVSIFAPQFLGEIAKGLKKQLDRWIL